MNGKLQVNHSGNGEVANPHSDDLKVFFWNDCGITIGCPEGKIGTLAFSDQNKADRNEIRAYSTLRDSRAIGMHHFSNQTSTSADVPSMSVCNQAVGINNAAPDFALHVNGSVGYGIEDEGDVTGNVTLSAATACAVWKLNPTNTPPKTAYLPAPASNTGRVLRVLNVNDAKPIRLKTISDGNFGGAADGSVSLTPQRHITVLCDGTSWYISQDS
jgi:hypothetical protein